MVEQEIQQLIRGCIEKDQKCQKMLYKAFYGFAMGICLRYANDRDQAAEVMNQGFYKVFTHIGRFDTSKPFKAWLGKIMMNVSIDHYRANIKMIYSDDLEVAEHISDEKLIDKNLDYEDLLAMVQKLPPAYRTVFNLFAIDGYSHEEIGEMLNINPGTSKSNLFKARQKLKEMILNEDASVTRNTFNGNGVSYTPIVALTAVNTRGIFFNRGIRG
jgi:RNA polymerase sigma-70 factor (ECF subfamily)